MRNEATQNPHLTSSQHQCSTWGKFLLIQREKILGAPFKFRISFPSLFKDQTMNCMKQMLSKTSSLAISPSVQNIKSRAQDHVKIWFV